MQQLTIMQSDKDTLQDPTVTTASHHNYPPNPQNQLHSTKKLNHLYSNSRRLNHLGDTLNRNYLNGKLSFVDFDKLKIRAADNAAGR